VTAGRLVKLIPIIGLALFACSESVPPFSVSHIDTSTGRSAYPLAVEPTQVGRFPGSVRSGGGYFYDDVLEYRVWLHPERGAEQLAGDEDYFAAFARYESAVRFSKTQDGAETPVVLVRQREHVNEPSPGQFEGIRSERIAEWKVEWLKDSKRTASSIPEFLAAAKRTARN
jgi:hypothetical protein